jgi:SNF2 family DNA or RNA helicase
MGQNAEKLRERIRPFLLRRMKADVLRELPEKQSRTLVLDMPPEQRSVYNAVMQRARTKIEGILDGQGFTRGRFEVLSLITELRQISCHPSLRFEGYQGSSGKVDALLDLLPGAIENGHRVLLFSSFTKMLKLLRARFEEAGIECMYLDGSTPTVERLRLVEEFNRGGDTNISHDAHKTQTAPPLFLISLKAGGFGLNLTGADMVIHVDPWWNPAAEEQASDRAHRIGQTRTVSVIRLISRNTIEEQVEELQRRKQLLYDRLIDGKPTDLAGVAFDEGDVRRMVGI